MKLTVRVEGLPPVKDGSSSLWTTSPNAERVASLREAAHAQSAEVGPIDVSFAIDVVTRTSDRARSPDLDNVVSGVLDGLQRAPDSTGWADHPAWASSIENGTDPRCWWLIEDDRLADRVVGAREEVGPGKDSYTVTLKWGSSKPGVEWLQDAIPGVYAEVRNLRVLLRLWIGVRNANKSRWFGGSGHLHARMEAALRTEFLMGLRRVTDHGQGREFTLPNLLRVLRNHPEYFPAAPEGGAMALQYPERRSASLNDAWKLSKKLRNDEKIEHLRRIADKLVAHPNPIGLGEADSVFEGVRPDEKNLEMMVHAATEVSSLYRVVQPSLSDLDGTTLSDDPFVGRLQQRGLPPEDYPLMRAFAERDGDNAWDLEFIPVRIQLWDRLLGEVETDSPIFTEMVLEDARHQADRERHSELSDLAQRWRTTSDAAFETLLDDRVQAKFKDDESS